MATELFAICAVAATSVAVIVGTILVTLRRLQIDLHGRVDDTGRHIENMNRRIDVLQQELGRHSNMQKHVLNDGGKAPSASSVPRQGAQKYEPRDEDRRRPPVSLDGNDIQEPHPKIRDDDLQSESEGKAGIPNATREIKCRFSAREPQSTVIFTVDFEEATPDQVATLCTSQAAITWQAKMRAAANSVNKAKRAEVRNDGWPSHYTFKVADWKFKTLGKPITKIRAALESMDKLDPAEKRRITEFMRLRAEGVSTHEAAERLDIELDDNV